jgi:hypothetical protein
VRHLLIVGLLLLMACNNATPESRASRSAGKPSDQENADGKPKKKKKGSATGKDGEGKDRSPQGAETPDPAGRDGSDADGPLPGGNDPDPSQSVTATPEGSDAGEPPAEPALPASSLTWDGETVSGTSTLNLIPTE